MTIRHRLGLFAAVAVAMTLPAHSAAASGGSQMKADLSGFGEVPAVSTTGRGELLLVIAEDGTSIDYTLSYDDLEGTTTSAAHIHFAQADVNGGVGAFLCGGGGKPDCPSITGTVSGTIIAADVVGPAGQGIAAGEFEELIAALRGRVTYVNVHTDKHPGGEIRGAIK
jgi:hypothetical protein